MRRRNTEQEGEWTLGREQGRVGVTCDFGRGEASLSRGCLDTPDLSEGGSPAALLGPSTSGGGKREFGGPPGRSLGLGAEARRGRGTWRGGS